MKTNIEITEVAYAAGTADHGRAALASCLLGGSSTPPSALGSLARGTTAFVGAGRFVGDERPTWAPAARVAHSFGYAPAADGARDKEFLAKGNEAVAHRQFSKMRAFRGLEPWRDPA